MGTVSVESCWRGEHSLLEFLAFSELLRAYVYSLPNSGKFKKNNNNIDSVYCHNKRRNGWYVSYHKLLVFLRFLNAQA